MPTYAYECSKCGHIQDEFHYMSERPLVHCDACRGACIKLIGTGEFISGMNGGRATYDFVDFHTTGKPVVIKSKRQWQQHLKAHGLNDDVPNDTKEIVNKVRSGNRVYVDKEKMKRDTKEAIVKSVKDQKWKSEFKQKVKKELYEARNGKGGK